ncbi:MAG TPA: helix-turn-helix domain-containing protein [Clostridiaceae bacterium]|nr:helix-turn-helix domain-containing protein [Clostridiaceae bacterium]
MDENKDILQIIGNNIKIARNQRNYTQSKLAEYLEVSDKFVSLLESGKSGLSITNVIKICKILKIEPNTLFKDVFTYDDEIDKNIIDKLSILTEEDKQFLNNSIDYILSKSNK